MIYGLTKLNSNVNKVVVVMFCFGGENMTMILKFILNC